MSGIKSAFLTVGQSLPIYLDKQTFSETVGMSQTCHKGPFVAGRRCGEQRLRYGQAERLCGLEIDNQHTWSAPADANFGARAADALTVIVRANKSGLIMRAVGAYLQDGPNSSPEANRP